MFLVVCPPVVFSGFVLFVEFIITDNIKNVNTKLQKYFIKSKINQIKCVKITINSENKEQIENERSCDQNLPFYQKLL